MNRQKKSTSKNNNHLNISYDSSLVSHQNTQSNEVLYWLNSQGSLTSMLEKKAGQPLRVIPFFEGYRILTREQKMKLGMTRSLNRPVIGWIRESRLYGNDERPWVEAQSIFPLPSLSADARRLKHLQGTPIGYVLYKRQKHLPNTRSISCTEKGWCRQTLYDWKGRHVLISETFLAGFFDVV